MQQIREGDVRLVVPALSEKGYSPSESPVFYNPHMELNRDITVAAVAAWVAGKTENSPQDRENITYLDSMAASGIRGIRIAREAGIDVTLNDFSETACSLIHENIRLNGLSGIARVSCKNVGILMHEQKFDIIDLDPFGSPAPFMDAAASGARGLLAVTATDTAPLCGAHLNSGMRKYGAVPLNTEYHAEMGARVLLGYMARILAMHDKAMKPLLTHVTRHYVRTYVSLAYGAKAADRALGGVGFIGHCPFCGMVEMKKGLASFPGKSCPFCGRGIDTGGPVWLGSLHEKSFCEAVIAEIKKRTLDTGKKALKIIETCRDELDIPMFYDQHKICKQTGISAPSMEEFLSMLREKGFAASRTHFNGTSFKTDADILQIGQIIKSIK